MYNLQECYSYKLKKVSQIYITQDVFVNTNVLWMLKCLLTLSNTYCWDKIYSQNIHVRSYTYIINYYDKQFVYSPQLFILVTHRSPNVPQLKPYILGYKC